MVRSYRWNFRVWIQKVGDSTSYVVVMSGVFTQILNFILTHLGDWYSWLIRTIDGFFYCASYIIGMQVEFDMKGTGKSKKTPVGRGKGGSGPSEKKGAWGSGAGAKRRRWEMMKAEALVILAMFIIILTWFFSLFWLSNLERRKIDFPPVHCFCRLMWERRVFLASISFFRGRLWYHWCKCMDYFFLSTWQAGLCGPFNDAWSLNHPC